MTPEELLKVKILALQVFISAVAQTISDQAALRANLATRKETLETLLLHSERSDEDIQAVSESIADIERLVWGPESPAP
jgi:hypothetical protein